MKKKEKNIKKKLPEFKSNKAAAKFLNSSDLSDYIRAENLVPMKFELRKKDKSITLRLPLALLLELKAHAHQKNIAYQKIIREALEIYLYKKSA